MDWSWARDNWGKLGLIGTGVVSFASFVGAYLAVDVQDFLPVSNRRMGESLHKLELKGERNQIEILKTQIEVLLAREERLEDRIDDYARRQRAEPHAFWIADRAVEAKKRLEAVQREKERLYDVKAKLENK